MSIQASNNINIEDILNNYLCIENNRFSYCEVCHKKKKYVKWFNNPLPFYNYKKYSICKKCELNLNIL